MSRALRSGRSSTAVLKVRITSCETARPNLEPGWLLGDASHKALHGQHSLIPMWHRPYDDPLDGNSTTGPASGIR